MKTKIPRWRVFFLFLQKIEMETLMTLKNWKKVLIFNCQNNKLVEWKNKTRGNKVMHKRKTKLRFKSFV